MAADGNLKGFVIIRLPSPDDPLQKKTFEGAIAYHENADDNPDFHNDEFHQDRIDGDDAFPLQRDDDIPSLPLSQRRRFPFFKAKGIASVFFVTMVAYFLWRYGPETFVIEEELGSKNNDDNDSQQQAPVFNIYSKIITRDVQRSAWSGTIAEASPSPDSREKSTTIFPLRGNVYPDGLYYVVARLGNPAREYFLDMDTGSDLTWLQCDAPCSNCAKGPHPLYIPRKGNLVDCSHATCTSVQAGTKFACDNGVGQCDYEVMYADGGYSLGVLVEDQMTMILSNRSWGHTKAVIGCAYNQQGSLAKSPTSTDGVLGLSSSIVSLPSQLAQQGIIKNIFAHCISGDVGGGGYLFLGDKLLPSHGITWAPLVGKPAAKNYMVTVQDVYYGDYSIQTGSRGFGTVIFDSGSSYTYLTPSLYAKLTFAIQNSLAGNGFQRDMTDKTLPFCWKYDITNSKLKDAVQNLKPLVFEFKSSGWFSKASKMHLSPEGYLIVNSKGNVCLGLLDGKVLDSDGLNIIGDISMRGNLVIYDNENSRIGWMKMDCRKLPTAAVPSPST
ncbi:hypothetical protein KP509_02G086000 [Ceratopteris richardii]|uniref:Peptidase A1 domain-containing protein n=1 Tax=Ceratopteris richardii TaxID=49495 RepID=A0A8T2VFY9_CERRI|nr:hypothetical protein KP509_02G086000 [Ceratopteris richardii]KAH7444643.1 hypothetical protein KP509_02G086000 [Ceratopteris richardii]